MLVRVLEWLQPLRRLPVWAAYTLTALIVLAFVALRAAITSVDESGNLPLFLLFVPAVIMAAMLFDKGSGFFAVFLSSAIGLVFFIEPVGALAAESVGEVLRLIFFIIIGAFTAALIESFRHTIDDLRAVQVKLEEANRHRDLLLSDINHRIKNHLGSLSAVLSLSKRNLSDDSAKEALDVAISRLAVLGRVYTRLHISDEDVRLDAKEFLEGLCEDLSHSLLATRPIVIRPDLAPMQMNAQTAISLGLILNELVANAIKYAFPEDRPGSVTVRLTCEEPRCMLEVEDDGVGLPLGNPTTGTGTRLIRSLSAQLGATVEWDGSSGTRVRIVIPSAALQAASDPADAAIDGGGKKLQRSIWSRFGRRGATPLAR